MGEKRIEGQKKRGNEGITETNGTLSLGEWLQAHSLQSPNLHFVEDVCVSLRVLVCGVPGLFLFLFFRHHVSVESLLPVVRSQSLLSSGPTVDQDDRLSFPLQSCVGQYVRPVVVGVMEVSVSSDGGASGEDRVHSVCVVGTRRDVFVASAADDDGAVTDLFDTSAGRRRVVAVVIVHGRW